MLQVGDKERDVGWALLSKSQVDTGQQRKGLEKRLMNFDLSVCLQKDRFLAKGYKFGCVNGNQLFFFFFWYFIPRDIMLITVNCDKSHMYIVTLRATLETM